MAAAGGIVPDDLQRALAATLDRLNREIEERANQAKAPGLAKLLMLRKPAPAPRGLYIWGGVGRGKTLLMDLFFEAASSPRKRRLHFHQFMAEVHDRAAHAREKHKRGEAIDDEPVALVAADIAAEIELLCFDEFAVYDIADAMILGRLFEQLFRRGVVVVATTNVAPDSLYEGGLNRALFLPFVALIKQHMAVFHLDAPRDYRLDSEGTERRYITPLGPEADACLDAHFRHLTGNDRGEATEVANRGRRIHVPEAKAGVARFRFEELCSQPLSADDYSRLAESFHTIIFSDVPILSPLRRNEAKRMINLVDTLYDRRVRLIVSAAAKPDALWHGTGVEAFEFQRTASRLIEMRSDAYWHEATRKKEAQAF